MKIQRNYLQRKAGYTNKYFDNKVLLQFALHFRVAKTDSKKAVGLAITTAIFKAVICL